MKRARKPTESQLLACAVEAVRAAARHALRHRRRRGETAQWLPRDVKLVLDHECQRKAEAVIRRRFPDHAILGEEGHRQNADADADFEWIIDPIDGTVNYSHGLPIWCSSVAVRRGGEVLAGAVYAPELNALYTATAHGPARRNGHRIHVSDIRDPSRAIMATGLAAKTTDTVISRGVFEALARLLQRVRIMGAAAVDLCHVACGALEGYVETSIFVWDVAAAGLIVRRAGGVTEVLEDLGENRMRFLATNGHLHETVRTAILEVLRTVRPERRSRPAPASG